MCSTLRKSGGTDCTLDGITVPGKVEVAPKGSVFTEGEK